MRPLSRLLFPVLFFALMVAPAFGGADCGRVYGIGDIHGGYDALVSILEKAGLVDDETNWSGGSACLVQTGDIVDRGERSREVLELLMKLEGQAGGRLTVLLGNHEVMNLTGDLRYVARGEFGAYAADETEAERTAGYEVFSRLPAFAELPDDAREVAFDRAHPPGWFAHRRAFSPGGRYWEWLVGKRIVTSVRDTLFVHGGLSLRDAEAGIDSLNEQAAADIPRFVELRRGLERTGVIHPLLGYGDAVKAVKAWVAANRHSDGPDAAPSVTEQHMLAQGLLALLKSPIFRGDGPLWDRRFAQADDGEYGPKITRILEAAGVRRALVGHSTTEDHVVHARFGDRVFLMDTGAGPAYGGQVSTIEVAPSGRVRAIYPADEVILGQPDREWLERALLEGEILESKPLGTGVTHPDKLLIEWEGERIKAVFKSVDVEERGLTVMANATAEINFTDSYRWELGAYLLDGQLGLNMVPVAVERRVKGELGAVIEWIEDAISETQRIEGGIQPPADSGRAEKVGIMLAFDALIYNVDRNPGNWLWTHDWQLYLIDHSRSFRLNKKLPKNVADTSLRIPRWLYERIRKLDLKTLQAALSEAVGKGRVKMILKRRDALVAQIEKQRQEFGDEFVFGK